MNARKIALKGLGGILIIGSLMSYGLTGEEPEVKPLQVKKSKTEQAIANLIKDDQIASAIAKTKYPLTIAAIKYVESECSGPHIIGDHGKSYGMYQIQQHIWGEFDKSIQGQTDKVEEILEHLINEKGYYAAIKSYNGTGSKSVAYRKKVLTVMAKLRKEVTA